ncbi:hypothetical protein D9613_001464 [Agrocybe pediades]|uniref:Uncharacterized protein n=1 Tax=Agrocybe pediades TaxID=84607 RepID=A0A8H4R838_9AGAR|nr:hypothetical protein D9613_001464 [Agrocybe pediades]
MSTAIFLLFEDMVKGQDEVNSETKDRVHFIDAEQHKTHNYSYTYLDNKLHTQKMNFTFPESPRSSSSKLSDVSGSPPKLDMSTLAILDNYFSEKAEQERLFRELAAEKAAAEVAGLALEADDEVQDKPMISVADYKLAFGEDWQLSQFW